MIHFLQVAQFVHDQVVLQFGTEHDDTIAEIQVPLAGTATPFGHHVLNGDSVVGQLIMEVEVFEPFVDEFSGCFFVAEVMGPCWFSWAYPAGHPFKNPAYHERF